MNLMWFVDKFYNKSPRIRRLISRLLFGDQDILIKLFDTDLIINTMQESGYLRAFRMCEKSSLLRDEVSVFISISMILDEGDSFVDVGANVGIFSSIFSRYKHLFHNFNIYAFEANPKTYRRLYENSIKHEFQTFNVGISDKQCELEFVEGAVSHVFTTVENASAYNITNEIIKVPCHRLDEFNFLGDSIIIKIDVEGQELQVLEGAAQLFINKRVKAVYLDGFAHQEEIISFLQKYKFSFFDGRNLTRNCGKVFSLLAISQEKFLITDESVLS